MAKAVLVMDLGQPGGLEEPSQGTQTGARFLRSGHGQGA